jgi:hypothetical protein
MQWANRTDDEIFRAFQDVANYTEAAQEELYQEAKRRRLELARFSPFVIGQIRSRVNPCADGEQWESVDVSRASKWRRRVLSCPRILIAFGVFQLIFGLGELAGSADDGSFDTSFGVFYLCAGILSFWRVRVTAVLSATTLGLFVPLWALMVVLDVYTHGRLVHMRPLVFVALGLPSILGSAAILKYVKALTPNERKGQAAVQSRYFPQMTRPAVLVAVAGSFASLLLGFFCVLLWVTDLRGIALVPSLSGFSPTQLQILWLCGSALFLTAFWLWRFARRRAALTARELREVDTRKPILLLRSFEDDAIVFTGKIWRILSYWSPMLRFFKRYVSLEESLVAAASVYGPVLTIGAPGRQLRTVGAARGYAPAEGWQDAVYQMMQESAAIIAVLGMTGGLTWELCLIRDLGLTSKLVLAVPPLTRKELVARMDVVAASLPVFMSIPHRLITDSAVILAQTEGKPLVVTGTGRVESDYYEAIRQALPIAMRAGTGVP